MSQVPVGVVETPVGDRIEPALVAPARPAGVLPALVEASKPGITRLVTITALVGFVLAAVVREWTWGGMLTALLGCAAGTALSAAGANAINQYMERARDARMDRTRRRPIPSGRATPGQVLAAGLIFAGAGIATLYVMAGVVAAAISLACLLSYLLLYTPLKPLTVLSTLAGTIPGALPPLIGWAAAAGRSPGVALRAIAEPGALSLFALMTVWQMPHFLAIAWMYRDDYARGGYRVLPVVDPTLRGTAFAIALWTSALIPASILPAIVMPDRLGAASAGVALVTGAGFAYLAARLLRTRERADAKRLFFGSIIHLPVLLTTFVAEGVLRAWLA